MLVPKACVMEVLHKRLAPTEGLHATVEVGVGRLISTHDSPDERQDAREVQVVQCAHDTVRGVRELEYRHMSAGFEYAAHLLQPRIEVTEIAASEGTGHAIEGLVRKRHFLCVTMHEVYVYLAFLTLRLADSHHLIGQVKSRHSLRFAPTNHLNGQVRRAYCHVQDMWYGRHQRHRLTPPAAVNIQ